MTAQREVHGAAPRRLDARSLVAGTLRRNARSLGLTRVARGAARAVAAPPLAAAVRP